MAMPLRRDRSPWPASLLGPLLSLAALLAAPVHAAMPALPLIPWPDRVETCPGAVELDAKTRLVAPGQGRTAEVAGLLRDALAEQVGLALAPATAAGDATRIELRHDPQIAGEEAYRLEIGPHGVLIAARSDAGLLWGVQTFRQLLPAGSGGAIRLPCLLIEDAPALAYRGQMLDVARHFYPVAFIKRQLDVLSYYKLNTFHWHLSDDQGWRLQIKRYPRLTEVGAWRTEPDGSRHGGFYTQDDVREVVEYARRRGITVIPEIEMPGHATAALVAYPQLGCVAPPPAVPNYWGVHKEIFCAGKEEVFTFLQEVLDEVVALFPAPYVHIGGDEVPKQRWQECAPCQALMRREGLQDEHELQSWFVRRIQAYLQGRGRRLIGWDEILEGGADRDAVIEVWRGEAEGRKALANGNRIVNAGPYYFSTLQDQLGLQEVFRRDPLSDPSYRANAAQVWGAEAPMWSEHITPRNGEAMLYPRMLAFAEIAWNAGEPHDFADFQRRLPAHYGWLTAQGIAYGPEERPIAAYAMSYEHARKRWLLRAAHGFADMRSHYRLDGRVPGRDDPGFTTDVAIDRGGEVRVAPFRGERQWLEAVAFRLVSHLGLGATVDAATPAKLPYSEGVLVDGVLGGDASFADGTWAGWQGNDLELTIDLGRLRTVGSIATNFLQDSGSWIVLPRSVRYSVSDDGKRWRQVHRVDLDADAGRPERLVERVRWHVPQPVRARWLKVIAESYGTLPAGHAGVGHEAWMFADEVVIE